jgi:hypothetical protein
MLHGSIYPKSLARLAAYTAALAVSCAALPGASAQQPDSLNLQQELLRLGEAATELEHTLPSFTCQESALSQQLKNGKVLQGVQFVATLRAQRGADGKLDESITITSVNGQPFTNGHFHLPVFVSGGFDRMMRYFAPEEQACYRYSLAPGRINFQALPGPDTPTCKDSGTVGFALLDAAGNATRVERRVDQAMAKPRKEAIYAAADIAPIELNGHSYRLAHHLYAEMPAGKEVGAFTADYAACKLFTATVTISPATPAHDTPAAPPE